MMKELNTLEIKAVNGGGGPLLYVGYVAGAYAVGWVAGYANEKYKQYKENKAEPAEPAGGCAPTC